MSEAPVRQRTTAILPCNNLDVAQAFFERLGFAIAAGSQDSYRMMSDGMDDDVHLNAVVPGWVTAERNPFGLYLYREDVDALAARFRGEIIEGAPEDKPWGMYEFALNGPDGVLVRIGWPTRLRRPSITSPPASR